MLVFRFLISIVLLFSAPLLCLAGTKTMPIECGGCHTRQYSHWTDSKHYRENISCNNCHGVLHSAKLDGCRKCHGNKHEDIFRSWPEVQRFNLPDSSDYVCIVCHDAHRGGFDANRGLCGRCHGKSMKSKLLVTFHSGPAEFVDPTENDGFVLLGTIINRYNRLSSVLQTLTLMIFSLLLYFIGTLVLFPVSLGLVVISKTTPL